MSGSIENVDAEVLILELQNGRCNGNTSLFFNFHPVGHSMTVGFFALYRTCLIYCASVQEKLFGKGSFTCVRVGDDGECTPSVYFFF